jgi:hypothetical protein
VLFFPIPMTRHQSAMSQSQLGGRANYLTTMFAQDDGKAFLCLSALLGHKRTFFHFFLFYLFKISKSWILIKMQIEWVIFNQPFRINELWLQSV